jgi:hypothetical protein
MYVLLVFVYMYLIYMSGSFKRKWNARAHTHTRPHTRWPLLPSNTSWSPGFKHNIPSRILLFYFPSSLQGDSQNDFVRQLLKYLNWNKSAHVFSYDPTYIGGLKHEWTKAFCFYSLILGISVMFCVEPYHIWSGISGENRLNPKT